VSSSSLHVNPNIDITALFDELRRLNMATNFCYVDSPQIDHSSKGIAYKTGRATRKVVNYFKRTDTKVMWLLSTWIVETLAFVLTVMTLIVSGALITTALFVTVYLYTSYALFSILSQKSVSLSLK
jgi:hypothetical protein